jgi:hypothetical protein
MAGDDHKGDFCGVANFTVNCQQCEIFVKLFAIGSSRQHTGKHKWTYGSSHEYQRWSYLLRGFLHAMRDLRQLFVLLLRQFSSKFHCRRLLCDIITGNHLLLTTLKQVDEFPACVPRFDMTEHLSQFCTTTILARYGSALTDFRTNGPFINESIFSILLHITNDLGKIDLLLHPVILRPFVKIWEESLYVSFHFLKQICCH